MDAQNTQTKFGKRPGAALSLSFTGHSGSVRTVAQFRECGNTSVAKVVVDSCQLHPVDNEAQNASAGLPQHENAGADAMQRCKKTRMRGGWQGLSVQPRMFLKPTMCRICRFGAGAHSAFAAGLKVLATISMTRPRSRCPRLQSINASCDSTNPWHMISQF